jgi:Tfp pilus assembly protein PilP
VGIAGDMERRVAIVEPMDGKGKSYPVTVGTVIGLNNGKVVEIKNDVIVIEEAIKGSARQKVNRIIKKLHKNEEEGTP